MEITTEGVSAIREALEAIVFDTDMKCNRRGLWDRCRTALQFLSLTLPLTPAAETAAWSNSARDGARFTPENIATAIEALRKPG